jgi:Family of unknown function (DUF5683)
MNRVRHLLFLAGFLALHHCCWCQNDTIPSSIKGKQGVGVRVTDSLPHNDNIRHKGHKDSPYAVDSLAKKKHDPRKATLYSTFLPGLGQIYNHKYWKLPIVWAAVGIPAYTYFYNKGWYKRCQGALAIVDNYAAMGVPIPDAVVNSVNPQLRPFLTMGDDNGLRTYRNEFRQNQDYSALFFLLFWGLNIVDATVDAHLMSFDVSDNLSMNLQPPSGNEVLSGAASITATGGLPAATGISLVFNLHKARYKTFSLQ